jgi:hypothetical protein
MQMNRSCRQDPANDFKNYVHVATDAEAKPFQRNPKR